MSVKLSAPEGPTCPVTTVGDTYATVLTIDTGNGYYGVYLTLHEENTNNILYQILAGTEDDVTKASLITPADLALNKNAYVQEQCSKGPSKIFVQTKNAVAGVAGKISIKTGLVP